MLRVRGRMPTINTVRGKTRFQSGEHNVTICEAEGWTIVE